MWKSNSQFLLPCPSFTPHTPTQKFCFASALTPQRMFEDSSSGCFSPATAVPWKQHCPSHAQCSIRQVCVQVGSWCTAQIMPLMRVCAGFCTALVSVRKTPKPVKLILQSWTCNHCYLKTLMRLTSNLLHWKCTVEYLIQGFANCSIGHAVKWQERQIVFKIILLLPGFGK